MTCRRSAPSSTTPTARRCSSHGCGARWSSSIAAPTSAVSLLFRMVFVDGLVHCDMHAGNLFVRPDGSLVLVDFGFVCELSPADRRAFTDFFLGFATGDGRRAADVVVDTALAL